MNLVRYRNAIVVAVVATYLLLNYGMQVVKIPPGRYGVPVGELCLVFALVFCRHRFVLPLFASTGVFWAFGAWWFLGAMHLIRAVPEHGFWAFRDASQLIESGFLYLGFCLSVSEITRLKRWVPWFLAVAVLYGLTYPVREPLQALSPLIQTSSGREAFLFFSYISSSTLLVLASFMLIMYAAQVGLRERFLLIVLAALLLSFTVYAYQQRTIYLQIASLVLLSAALNARFRRLLPVIFGSFVVVLAVFPYLGINLQSRLGIDAGLGFIGNHLLAIAGIGSEGLEGAAGGVGQRLGWWYSIYLKVSASWFTGLFGLGYGQPLIDFIGHGVVVREPHNSIVTAFGRTGILGLLAWFVAHAYLAVTWITTYRYAVRNAHATSITFLKWVLFYSALIWVFSLGEDAFEKPYNAIPYYFLWGCVLKTRIAQKYTALSSPEPALKNNQTSLAATL